MKLFKTAVLALTFTVLIGFIFFATACNEAKMGEMSVKLTNSASKKTSTDITTKDLSLLTAINLDVQGCEVHYSDTTSPAGWVSLATTTGIYNVLDLDTDATVVLVNELTMPAGHITQMRLLLGNNNSIVIAGTIYPLKVPSGEQSGLKINLKEYVSFTSYIEVVLDFDPLHSVVEQGNGGYILKPVIQVDVVNQL